MLGMFLVGDIVAQFERKKHVFFFNDFLIVDSTFELTPLKRPNDSLAFYVLGTRFIVLSHRVVSFFFFFFFSYIQRPFLLSLERKRFAASHGCNHEIRKLHASMVQVYQMMSVGVSLFSFSVYESFGDCLTCYIGMSYSCGFNQSARYTRRC